MLEGGIGKGQEEIDTQFYIGWPRGLIKTMTFEQRLEAGEWISGERVFQTKKGAGERALRWAHAQCDGGPAGRPGG